MAADTYSDRLLRRDFSDPRLDLTAVRSYIAGTGAASALVGAATVAFILLTALVAFDAFTIRDGGGGTDAVTIARGSAPGGASETVGVPGALGVAGAATAVAAAPVAPTVVASTTGTNPEPGETVVVPTGTPVPPGPGDVVVPPDGSIPIPGAPPVVDGGNPVQNVAGGLDRTIENATGTNPGLSRVTAPVTDLVDQTLQNLTGEDLGGTLDNLGLQNPLTGKPLVGEQGEGLLGTGLLP